MIRKQRGDIDTRQMKNELDSLHSPASLAKSHKIIRTEQAKEQLFFKLCKQIEENSKREERGDSQREDRRQKRIRILT